MLAAQLVRLAIIVLALVAFLGRGTWPGVFLAVKHNLFWIIAVYVAITLFIRVSERRRRDRSKEPAVAWECEVCETENAAESTRCERCTVPKPTPA